MLDEPQNQFSFTRAALSTTGRAKGDFLSVPVETGIRIETMGTIQWKLVGIEGYSFRGKILIQAMTSQSAILSNPPWFYVLIAALVAGNILAGLLIRVPNKILRCKQCGQVRPPAAPACPECGAKELRMPFINRLALGSMVLLLAAMGTGLLITWLLDTSPESRRSWWQVFSAALMMLCSAGAVAAYSFGVKSGNSLGGLLLKLTPVGDEVQRLRYDQTLAVRVTMLVLSVVVIVLATWFMMKHS